MSLVPAFTRNAAATLRASPVKQAIVQKLVSSVKAIFDGDLDRPEPIRLAGLRRKLDLAVTLREIAERALKAEMNRSSVLQSEVNLLKMSLSALAHESQEALKVRDDIIAKLKSAGSTRQPVATLVTLLK